MLQREDSCGCLNGTQAALTHLGALLAVVERDERKRAQPELEPACSPSHASPEQHSIRGGTLRSSASKQRSAVQQAWQARVTAPSADGRHP